MCGGGGGAQFTLGKGQVIKGWDLGFASMCKGEKAVLICQAKYGHSLTLARRQAYTCIFASSFCACQLVLAFGRGVSGVGRNAAPVLDSLA